jgi:membrane fusion protein (multidrug efflux system)
MSTSPETTSALPSPRKPRTAARVAFAVVIVAICAWLGHFAYRSYVYEETDDATVEAHIHQVSAQIDGTVREVLVKDNQTVAAGDILARLDPLEFELMVEREQAGEAQSRAEDQKSEASSVQAQAQLAGAQARRGAAQAQVTQATVQQDLASLNRGRARQLFHDGGAVTQADLDNAESAYSGAQAALAAAQANVHVADAAVAEAEASMESAKAESLSAKASTLAFKAAVTDARRKLAYATLTAPAAGRMGNKNVEVGNRVEAGQVLFALVETNPWIVANFKETQLARIHPGLAVDVLIDALPGVTLHGTIDSISPASGAQFALLPPDNATGNFTKVVQRVAVKVTLDPEGMAEERLRPGLSAVVSVRVR